MNQFQWKYTLSDTSVCIEANKLLKDFSDNGCAPLIIDALTDSVLRIHTRTTPSFAIETLPKAAGHLQQISDTAGLVLETSSLRLTLDDQLKLQIADLDGQILCADYTGPKQTAETLSEEELEQMRMEGHAVSDSDNACRYTIYKQTSPDEKFYGLGDKTGVLNKRGYDYIMWNSDLPDPHVENNTFRALYKSIPFFISLSSRGVYGIFFDNHFKSFFDMGYNSKDYYSFGAVSGDLDYYFIHGKTIAEVITQYTALTGRSPLPQLWTLGYHQSRWSYYSAQEVLELARTFRKYDIPCDAIHLDIDYMDHFKVFTVDKQRFGDLKELSDALMKMGIKLVTIIDPGTKAEEGYDMYEEGLKEGYFAQDSDGQIYHNVVWPGDSVYPDYTSSKVRSWWGAQTRRLTDLGVRGIWNDMNEPASFRGPLPDDVVFPGDGTPRLHKEVHNVYGHLMAKATYEGLKKYDKRRPFIITRACYSGTQKYSTAWTGDNQSLWAHLKMSVPQLLNLGMSGLPFVGTDIAGFGANTTPELFARWIEAGCFAPLFRNHSAKDTRRQEPWRFGEEVLSINRKYISLRYKFLPYIYDLCREESLTGVPMLRPLVMHYQDDPDTWECNDEYLVGDSILAAPVTDQGVRHRVVYLPEGTWVDHWTGERIAGKRHILREAPLDVCPLYIKAGSLLPTWPAVDHVPEHGVSSLILEYYPDTLTSPSSPAAASYKHYQDNGTDFAYEQGEYNLYHFEVTSEDTTLSTTLEHDGYDRPYESVTLHIC